MLVLSRKIGEQIVIADNIIVEVVRVKGNRVKLGLLAPSDVKVLRSELLSSDNSIKESGIGPAGNLPSGNIPCLTSHLAKPEAFCADETLLHAC